MLELSKVILGGTIGRKKGYTYKLQRPGADHHACWMAKAIYILKMSFLRHQLDLYWQTKKKVEKMSLFVVFVYLKSWFSAPCLTSAATNDLELYRRFLKFKTVHKKVSSTAASVRQRHTWYLTEELIPLSLSLSLSLSSTRIFLLNTELSQPRRLDNLLLDQWRSENHPYLLSARNQSWLILLENGQQFPSPCSEYLIPSSYSLIGPLHQTTKRWRQPSETSLLWMIVAKEHLDWSPPSIPRWPEMRRAFKSWYRLLKLTERSTPTWPRRTWGCFISFCVLY